MSAEPIKNEIHSLLLDVESLHESIRETAIEFNKNIIQLQFEKASDDRYHSNNTANLEHNDRNNEIRSNAKIKKINERSIKDEAELKKYADKHKVEHDIRMAALDEQDRALDIQIKAEKAAREQKASEENLKASEKQEEVNWVFGDQNHNLLQDISPIDKTIENIEKIATIVAVGATAASVIHPGFIPLAMAANAAREKAKEYRV